MLPEGPSNHFDSSCLPTLQCLSAVSSSISVMRSRLPPFLPSHPISRRRTENIPPRRHRSKQKRRRRGSRLAGNFFISTQIQYERYDRGRETKGEGGSGMLARGPSSRLCSSSSSLGLLARSAQYIFMKDVTGGGRASCGRREAVNVPLACFHVASQVMDSRLEAPCSLRHYREHFYLIAYLAREFTRT